MALLPPSRDPHPHAHPADAAMAQAQHDQFSGAYSNDLKCTCLSVGNSLGACKVHGWVQPLLHMQPKAHVEPSRPFETTDFPTNDEVIRKAKEEELNRRFRDAANVRAVGTKPPKTLQQIDREAAYNEGFRLGVESVLKLMGMEKKNVR